MPDEVLALVAIKAPNVLIGIYNRCIKESVFSTRWKEARLVLLRKSPDKPVTSPSSFRLLCMLDSVGKLLEMILLQRLNDHLIGTVGLSPNQFGFRKGKSTEDALNKVLNVAK